MKSINKQEKMKYEIGRCLYDIGLIPKTSIFIHQNNLITINEMEVNFVSLAAFIKKQKDETIKKNFKDFTNRIELSVLYSSIVEDPGHIRFSAQYYGLSDGLSINGFWEDAPILLNKKELLERTIELAFVLDSKEVSEKIKVESIFSTEQAYKSCCAFLEELRKLNSYTKEEDDFKTQLEKIIKTKFDKIISNNFY